MDDFELTPVVGIFDEQDADVRTLYRARVKFTDVVMGGIPKDPNLVEAWLKTRVMGGDEVLRQRIVETLIDLEVDVPLDADKEQIIAAIKQVSAIRTGNGFRRNSQGLFLARYNVVAMLKEATSILYPYEQPKAGQPGSGCAWGKTRKAPRSFLAERVNVVEFRVPLGRMEPDGVAMNVGHVTTPKGKRSTLSYVDFCVQPEIEFTFSSTEDAITSEQWRRILTKGQELGLSAMRSQGYGQFKMTEFSRL